MSPGADTPVIAVTTGEPAGVGPELAVALLDRQWPAARIVLIGDRALLERRGGRPVPAPNLLHVPLGTPSVAGRLDAASARSVLDMLDAAVDGCMAGRSDAIRVTAPVHKGVINDAGMPFTGHTEYLAERTGARLPVMVLVGGGLRVALATTHLPLKAVAAAITRDSLAEVIAILRRELVEIFGIARPRIVVCGLNPHAGESGHLGREEIDTIEPVLDALRAEGMNLSGPLPADTLFAQLRKQPADAVLTMYHDQGLPVLKYASFGEGINVTPGLPFIRTSVDHGTALELAGTRNIETGSLLAAMRLAIELASKRA